MSVLAYTGPIYRQTKKKFLLEDESELQVDWMASKPVNFRFIRSPGQYSVGFWSHAKVLFKENFLRGIRWTTHLINKASILRAYGVPVTLRQLSPLNFALVTRRVWWEKGSLCSRRARYEEDWDESVANACSLRGRVAGVWKKRGKLGGGKLNKGARKEFPRAPSSLPRAWFSTIFFESPPHKRSL